MDGIQFPALREIVHPGMTCISECARPWRRISGNRLRRLCNLSRIRSPTTEEPVKPLKSLPHFLTGREIAHLFQQPPELIDRMVRCGIHPPWTWRKRWPEPRWPDDSFPAWHRILSDVDVSSIPQNPPPLEHPARTFRESRFTEPAAAQIEQFLSLFPKREQERLRALGD